MRRKIPTRNYLEPGADHEVGYTAPGSKGRNPWSFAGDSGESRGGEGENRNSPSPSGPSGARPREAGSFPLPQQGLTPPLQLRFIPSFLHSSIVPAMDEILHFLHIFLTSLPPARAARYNMPNIQMFPPIRAIGGI